MLTTRSRRMRDQKQLPSKVELMMVNIVEYLSLKDVPEHVITGILQSLVVLVTYFNTLGNQALCLG